MTEAEQEARRRAGKVALRYLEKCGAEISIDKDQFETFCDAFAETYSEQLIEITGADNPPFAVSETKKGRAV